MATLEQNHVVQKPLQMYNLHVFILNRRYFGYQSSGSPLEEYSREEVATLVRTAFDPKTYSQPLVFVDGTWNENTNIVIVPDHWDHIIPTAAKAIWNPEVLFVEFVYILHAKELVGNKNPMLVQRLAAPVNAQQLYDKSLERGPKESTPSSIPMFRVDRSSADDSLTYIRRYYENEKKFSGSADTMQPQNKGRRRHSVSKKSSWHAHMDTMLAQQEHVEEDSSATSSKLREEQETNEYERAWLALREKAQLMRR